MRKSHFGFVVVVVLAMVACGDDAGTEDSAVGDTGIADSATRDGTLDSAVVDSATDSAVVDSGSSDSAMVDSGSADTGARDATLPDGAMCIPEGGSRPVVPGALPCCAGLGLIPCDAPGAGGECVLCAGAAFCTFCGNGSCDAPENECNCPDDC